MEELYVFGTGHAAVTRCYNTCFALKTGDEYFMTDAGGGNGILGILKDMDVDMAHIHHIFVTHSHTDHILGVIWMIRMIGSRILNGSYEGDLYVYCHSDLYAALRTICLLTLTFDIVRLFDDRIQMVIVEDGEELDILGHKAVCFDIHSTKLSQFGFSVWLDCGKLTCCGDEPLNPACESYAAGSDWMLHEAFCLYRERARFKPYEKHHSTVKDACELGERLSVRNLVLWHTEDTNLSERRERYEAEGKEYYHGNLFIPDDRQIIKL